MPNKKRKWRNFRSARKFIRSLGLKNDAQWRLYCKGELKDAGTKPQDIPTTPNIVYKELGWVDLGDWLGTKNVSNVKIRASYRSFRSARSFARSLNITSREEWQKQYKAGKIPKDIPLKPERVYEGKGWKNCGDWFGTGYVTPAMRTYRSFKDAKSFAKKLKLTSRRDWEEYCKNGRRGKAKLPKDIPATPARVYKDQGWKGWPDWLGK